MEINVYVQLEKMVIYVIKHVLILMIQEKEDVIKYVI